VTQLLSQNMLSKMNKRCIKMTRIYCIVTNDSFIAYNVASQEYMQNAVERFQCRPTVATCIVNITASQQYMEYTQHSSSWVAATCIYGIYASQQYIENTQHSSAWVAETLVYGIYASQQYMKNALTRFSWVVATRRLMK